MAVDINAAAAAETAEIITSEGGECAVCECDVSNLDQVEAMVAASEESWDRVMDINIKSVFLTCKYVLPLMIEQQGGTIVNIASIAGSRWLGVPYTS